MSEPNMHRSSDDWNKLKHLVDLSAENARLKEEVKLLTDEVSFDKRVQLHVDKLVAEFTQCQVERLQAEVERLRKAGDAMAAHILKIEEEVYEVTPCGGYYVIDEWNAAKEGKQP